MNFLMTAFPSFPINLSAELKEGGKAEERVEKKLYIYIFLSILDGQVESARGWRC